MLALDTGAIAQCDNDRGKSEHGMLRGAVFANRLQEKAVANKLPKRCLQKRKLKRQPLKTNGHVGGNDATGSIRFVLVQPQMDWKKMGKAVKHKAALTRRCH